MTAIVHGWCGFVEKSNDVVSQQMVLNKLWIPDVLIDIIKDYLYIGAEEVLRKFYRFNLNRSITDLTVLEPSYMIDVYGRRRIVSWGIGHVYTDGDVQLQGSLCFTCGDLCQVHQNVNGCCTLVLDQQDEVLDLVYNEGDEVFDASINWLSETIPETIPEVTWEIDIPVAQQETEADENYDDDIESYLEDYEELKRQIKMERFNDRL